MNKCFDKCGQALCWLALFGLLLLPNGCATQAKPTLTPHPTPDDLGIYLMLTERYTSFGTIMHVHDMSADEAARILQALQSIEPPAGLGALHEQALDAYRYICRGKLLLPSADSVLRAEAYFMVDWGISRLLDYREQIDKVRQ